MKAAAPNASAKEKVAEDPGELSFVPIDQLNKKQCKVILRWEMKQMDGKQGDPRFLLGGSISELQERVKNLGYPKKADPGELSFVPIGQLNKKQCKVILRWEMKQKDGKQGDPRFLLGGSISELQERVKNLGYPKKAAAVKKSTATAVPAAAAAPKASTKTAAPVAAVAAAAPNASAKEKVAEDPGELSFVPFDQLNKKQCKVILRWEKQKDGNQGVLLSGSLSELQERVKNLGYPKKAAAVKKSTAPAVAVAAAAPKASAKTVASVAAVAAAPNASAKEKVAEDPGELSSVPIDKLTKKQCEKILRWEKQKDGNQGVLLSGSLSELQERVKNLGYPKKAAAVKKSTAPAVAVPAAAAPKASTKTAVPAAAAAPKASAKTTAPAAAMAAAAPKASAKEKIAEDPGELSFVPIEQLNKKQCKVILRWEKEKDGKQGVLLGGSLSELQERVKNLGYPKKAAAVKKSTAPVIAVAAAASSNGLFKKATESIPGAKILSKDLKIEWKKRLGGGGNSSVFAGLWLGGVVAVKVLSVSHEDKDAFDAFERECALLQQLRHPNIVEFYGVSRDENGMPVIVMEKLDTTLERALKSVKEGKEKLDNKLALLSQVAQALCYLHCQRPVIVHRDVKPANILLDSGRKIAKLADFGISKVAGFTSSATLVMGTPAYIPPEAGKHVPYDQLSKRDVYALGITIWECLSNKQAVVGKKPALADLPDGTSHGLKSWIERSWAVEPEKRPTVSDLLKILLTDAAAHAEVEGYRAEVEKRTGGLEGGARFSKTAVVVRFYNIKWLGNNFLNRDYPGLVDISCGCDVLGISEVVMKPFEPSNPAKVPYFDQMRARGYEIACATKPTFCKGGGTNAHEYGCILYKKDRLECTGHGYLGGIEGEDPVAGFNAYYAVLQLRGEPSTSFVVISVHLADGEGKNPKSQRRKEIAEFAKRVANDPNLRSARIILGGDMNTYKGNKMGLEVHDLLKEWCGVLKDSNITHHQYVSVNKGYRTNQDGSETPKDYDHIFVHPQLPRVDVGTTNFPYVSQGLAYSPTKWSDHNWVQVPIELKKK